MTEIDILFSLTALVGIIYLFFWRFRQYRIDKFRQNIFAVRDNLFDYAAQGNIAFDHPAYITLRNMMNGYIRFSHRISCARLSAHWLSMSVSKHPFTEFSKTWADATADLPEPTRNGLETFLLRASAHLFYFIFLSSLAKKIVAAPIGLLIFARLALSKKKPTEEPIILNSAEGLRIFEPQKDRSTDLKVATYRYTEQHSEQVKGSIDHLNADALVYGEKRLYATAA